MRERFVVFEKEGIGFYVHKIVPYPENTGEVNIPRSERLTVRKHFFPVICKYMKDNKQNNLHFGRKYARSFAQTRLLRFAGNL